MRFRPRSFDEAHKFLSHAPLRERIELVIRERRHLGVSVVLLSQDPWNIPMTTLAELDGMGLFATASPKLVSFLAEHCEAFRDLRLADLRGLAPGELVFWSRYWYTPFHPSEFDDTLVRLQVRPRLTHHGGATRLAVR